jgi:hypothetical protein
VRNGIGDAGKRNTKAYKFSLSLRMPFTITESGCTLSQLCRGTPVDDQRFTSAIRASMRQLISRRVKNVRHEIKLETTNKSKRRGQISPGRSINN